MSDHDLIRRGDAREILEDEGFLGRSLDRLAALPAVTPAPDAAAIREAALREIESISVHSGGEVHGVTADHWRMAFEQAQDVARAALKGADHER